MSAKDIEKILPEAVRRFCRVGICNPELLERKKPVFCPIPQEYGGPRPSAKPSEVLPTVKSIITIVHFETIAYDYSAITIAFQLAGELWRRLKLKTHLLDKTGKPRSENIIGSEESFLKSSGYDARKKMILLKDLAYYAGLGQYGRNSLIINRHFGSNLIIQALFTQEQLRYDEPMQPRAYPGCKNCSICIDACPKGAIKDYKFIGLGDVCTDIVTESLSVIGRLPKDVQEWALASISQKKQCKICQSFCPANTKNYFKDSLVLARKEGQKRVRFFVVPEHYSALIRDRKDGKSGLHH